MATDIHPWHLANDKNYAIFVNKNKIAKNENAKHLSNNCIYEFLMQMPRLVTCKPTKCSIFRAKSASPENVTAYFTELSTRITYNGLSNKPNEIFNIDETGISTDHLPLKIFRGKNTNPQSITSTRSFNITIIAEDNVIDHILPQ